MTKIVWIPDDDPEWDQIAKDAMRYRWLRDGNGFPADIEACIGDGAALDKLCDEGMAK